LGVPKDPSTPDYISSRRVTHHKETIPMQASFRCTAIALALIGSVGLAGAAQLNLTSAQKQSILQSVASEKGQTAPAGFQAKLGEKVPQSLSMHQLPSSATSQVSAAKEYEYAKLQNNEVLLINPKDRQVAEIIMPSSTTGSAK
jgi:hypothetical protein